MTFRFESLERKLARCAREIAAGEPMKPGFRRDAGGMLSFDPPYITPAPRDMVAVEHCGEAVVEFVQTTPRFKAGDRLRLVVPLFLYSAGTEGVATSNHGGNVQFVLPSGARICASECHFELVAEVSE